MIIPAVNHSLTSSLLFTGILQQQHYRQLDPCKQLQLLGLPFPSTPSSQKQNPLNPAKGLGSAVSPPSGV